MVFSTIRGNLLGTDPELTGLISAGPVCVQVVAPNTRSEQRYAKQLLFVNVSHNKAFEMLFSWDDLAIS